MRTPDKPVIELLPPFELPAEELHSWGLIRRRTMTLKELEALYPRPKEK